MPGWTNPGNRVLVCGFYGFRNAGDEAMLSGLDRWLQRCGCDCSLTVYSKDPEDTRQRHGVAVLDNRYAPRRRAQLQQWLAHTAALASHRYFILGGGDLLRDDPDRDVAGEWLAHLERAIAFKKTTLVLGISVGKLWRPATRERIRRALSQTDLIAVRDRTSQARLLELDISQPVQLMADLALETVSFVEPRPPSPSPHIGLSLRQVAGRTNLADEAFFHTVAQAVDRLVETHNVSIRLLPFQTYPEEFRRRHRPPVDDEQAVRRVVALSRYPERFESADPGASLDSLIGALQDLDLVIGTRLHAVILASGLGIPAVALA